MRFRDWHDFRALPYADEGRGFFRVRSRVSRPELLCARLGSRAAFVGQGRRQGAQPLRIAFAYPRELDNKLGDRHCCRSAAILAWRGLMHLRARVAQLGRLLTLDRRRCYRLPLENTKVQSSMSSRGSSLIFTALRISEMSMPCCLADLIMQFATYFWRFRQCHLNFMPFASSLQAAVAFRRAAFSASDSFAASAPSSFLMQSFKNALLSGPLSFCSFACFRHATDFDALCSSCWVGLMVCATRSDFDVASDELCALAGSPASPRTITKILADTKRRSMLLSITVPTNFSGILRSSRAALRRSNAKTSGRGS